MQLMLREGWVGLEDYLADLKTTDLLHDDAA